MARTPEAARRTCRSRSCTGRWLASLVLVACGALLGCAQTVSEESASGATQQNEPTPSEPPSSSRSQASPAGPEDAETGSAAPAQPAEASDSPDSGPETEAADADEQIETQPPRRVQIPSIDLDESQLVDLHIRPDGRLEEPEEWDDVGWFAGGSKPGAAGPTIIAAHVDSLAGPAVFYRVLEMEPGDEVIITDDDGADHVYRVEHTQDFPKDDFPTREVFGTQLADELRLITCTGEFDAAASRHLDNRVVFAARID